MSIEDFETALTSKLIVEYNNLNCGGMYILLDVWAATLTDREMTKLYRNLDLTNPSYVQVKNIPEFARFLKAHEINVYITRMDGLGNPWAMISIG